MNKEQTQGLLREAEEIVETVSEPYRGAAFQAVVTQLLSQADGEARPGATKGAVRPSDAGLMPESLNELLALRRIKSHTDRLEAIIFHSLKRQGVAALTTDDILSAYSSARISKPANPSDVIARCFRRGHVMAGSQRDGQKTWQLTSTGERYIEQLLKEVSESKQ